MPPPAPLSLPPPRALWARAPPGRLARGPTPRFEGGRSYDHGRDDTNAMLHPGAPEVPEGFDDDCNGVVDG